MGEGLQTAGGTVLGVGPADDQDAARQFAAAMAAPEPDEPAVPSPPDKDPDAPYGRRADGTPKKGPGGRPPKTKAAKDADRPRVQTMAAAAAAAGAPRDYSRQLAELTDGIWWMLASLPPTQAQAALFRAHQGNLIHGFNIAAQNNGIVRRGVELVTGEATWVMVVGMTLAPFITQSLALWTAPDKLAAAGLSRDDLTMATVYALHERAAQQAEMMRAATGVDQAAAAAA